METKDKNEIRNFFTKLIFCGLFMIASSLVVFNGMYLIGSGIFFIAFYFVCLSKNIIYKNNVVINLLITFLCFSLLITARLSWLLILTVLIIIFSFNYIHYKITKNL